MHIRRKVEKSIMNIKADHKRDWGRGATITDRNKESEKLISNRKYLSNYFKKSVVNLEFVKVHIILIYPQS